MLCCSGSGLRQLPGGRHKAHISLVQQCSLMTHFINASLGLCHPEPAGNAVDSGADWLISARDSAEPTVNTGGVANGTVTCLTSSAGGRRYQGYRQQSTLQYEDISTVFKDGQTQYEKHKHE